ncbi:MAG: aminotransferase class I/II-fold pyridoxal phosphate-dependent enzyme, partial [Chitinophagaceae bacterium]|nr:aminotransferase class I/II-fold pyridoxal phosphate-dependent enzyme [Chitinophagaceae bacterium]
MSFNLDKLIRPNIKVLKPYSSAQDEYAGRDNILLNANENSIGSPLQREANFLKYNRYPDAYQKKVKEAIGHIKSVNPKNIFLGNGSDECIDLLYRCFCEPDKDNVIICPPTYGMYEVSANINNVEVRKAPLLENFQLDLIH